MSLKVSLATRIRHRFHLFPKVSVIIPIYNAESTLLRCLNSILWGSYIPLELICVNDGSTDKSLHILRSMRLQYGCIRIVNVPHNRGLYHARIKGIEHVRGKYIGFVDSDDYVEPRYFDRLYAAACKENVDIAVGKIVNQSADGVRYIQSRCEFFPYIENENDADLYQLYWQQAGKCYHWHVVWNKIYRRELWETQMPFLRKMNGHLTMLEDFIFSSVVLSRVNTYAVDYEAVYNYVESLNASTHDYSECEKIEKKISDMKNAFDFIEQYLDTDSSFIQFKTRLLEWKKRYGRYWKRNILQSDLCEAETEKCIHLLEQMADGKIGDVEDEDEYYYEVAKFL